MPAFSDSTSVDRNSPTLLKATFRTKLAGWGLDGAKLGLMAAVLQNWLKGGAAEDINHFRQRHLGKVSALNQLTSRTLVTNSSSGQHYELKFIAFCLLLANGNRTAIKLRSVMDSLFRLVNGYLHERPPVPRRPISTVLAQLPEEQRPLLHPAIKLLSETTVGISLGGPAHADPDLNFSDSILDHSSPTELAWLFLEQFGRNSWTSFDVLAPVSIPFDLARLQIAPEVHTSASKAVAALPSSPDSAVTQARAALEATFKRILGPGHPRLEDKLPRQSGAVLELLQLRGEFSDLGERLLAVMKAIGEIRNNFGDGHGRPPDFEAVTRPEAQLTVGTALLLCEFMLDRWEAVRSLPRHAFTPAAKAA